MSMRIVCSEATMKIVLIRPPKGKSKKWLISLLLLFGVSYGYNLLVATLKSSHFLASKHYRNIRSRP